MAYNSQINGNATGVSGPVTKVLSTATSGTTPSLLQDVESRCILVSAAGLYTLKFKDATLQVSLPSGWNPVSCLGYVGDASDDSGNTLTFWA